METSHGHSLFPLAVRIQVLCLDLAETSEGGGGCGGTVIRRCVVIHPRFRAQCCLLRLIHAPPPSVHRSRAPPLHTICRVVLCVWAAPRPGARVLVVVFLCGGDIAFCCGTQDHTLRRGKKKQKKTVCGTVCACASKKEGLALFPFRWLRKKPHGAEASSQPCLPLSIIPEKSETRAPCLFIVPTVFVNQLSWRIWMVMFGACWRTGRRVPMRVRGYRCRDRKWGPRRRGGVIPSRRGGSEGSVGALQNRRWCCRPAAGVETTDVKPAVQWSLLSSRRLAL